VLRILAWSAVLVIFRGTFRQAVNAAGYHALDLGCATAATGANVVLSLVLIPRYGMIGSAVATVSSELIWAVLIASLFARRMAGATRRFEHSYATGN
jgi:O-antigen/teichoic acid export membrane protein